MSKEDLKSSWATDPIEAHKQWRAKLLVTSERSYADHSNRLYQSLFAKFARWMQESGLSILTVRTGDIATFLEALTARDGVKSACARTQRSYLAEINRVMAFLQSSELRVDNPATDLLAQLKVTTPMKARSIMYMSEQVQVEYRKMLDQLEPDKLTSEQVMAHAIACLILEMAFTVKEIQKIVLENVRVSDRDESLLQVTAPGHRTLQPRTCELSDLGSKWLRSWLARRSELFILKPADYDRLVRDGSPALMRSVAIADAIPQHLARLFVTFAGKANRHESGLRSAKLAINRLGEDVIHAAANQVFMVTGESINGAYLSPQTLRNACGARLLNLGYSESEVAKRMGLIALDQIWALKKTAMVHA